MYVHVLSAYYIFFLMIRRPPRSTLFPTRRSSDLLNGNPNLPVPLDSASFSHPFITDYYRVGWDYTIIVRNERVRERGARSEEHTSELQSPDHLVCRLLLEKKNIAYTICT